MRTTFDLLTPYRPHPRTPVRTSRRYSRHAMTVLSFFARHRLALAAHVQRMFPDLFQSDRGTRMHLQTLVARRELDVREGHGIGQANVYSITQRGLRTIRETDDGDAFPDRHRRPTGSHLLHELLITEIAVATAEAVRQRPDLAIPWDERFGFTRHPAFRDLIPDYAYLLRHASGLLACFVEVQSGEESPTRVAAKLQAYAEWAATPATEDFLLDLYRRHGAQTPRPQFRLLLVVHDRRGVVDATRLRQCLGATLTLPRSMRHRTWLVGASDLATEGASTRRSGSGRKTSTRAMCRGTRSLKRNAGPGFVSRSRSCRVTVCFPCRPRYLPMALHYRICLTALLLRVLPALLLLGLGTLGRSPEGGAVLAAVWLVVASLLLRSVILPALFPHTLCPGCRRVIPLVGRWKCGDHFTAATEAHVLTFFCTHGHRLEAFDCPRCRATITVQRGDPKVFKHGSAIRLRPISQALSRESDHGLVIGLDPRKRPVILPPGRLGWHVAVTGGTGRGKSTLLLHLVRQLLQQGAGVTVLDPGGDLAQAVLGHIPPDRMDRLQYVNVGDRHAPFPLNVLAAHDAMEGAMLAEELLGVLHDLHGSSWGPLLAHQLRMALRTVMAVGGTLRDVYDLFTDDVSRGRLLRRLADRDLRAFWTREFPSIPPIRRMAVTNKLAPIVFHPLLSPVLCAPTCALDATELIARRGILCVNLASGSAGEHVTTLLGTFLVQKILAAAFRQAALAPENRVPHVLIVDEFQRFMHRAAGFDRVLSEARKYRLALIVANQFVEQLSVDVRASLFGNVGGLVAFRVGPHDARLLAPEFTGALPEDLLDLNLGQALVRIGTDWTTVKTFPPPAMPDDPLPVPAPVIVASNPQREDRTGSVDEEGESEFIR